MTSDGHKVPTWAFEETWIWIQRFKRHIWYKSQIVPKWVPRNTILPGVTRPIIKFCGLFANYYQLRNLLAQNNNA